MIHPTTICFHCNDICVTVIHLEEKVFCCQSCKNVYQLLNSNGLDSYYHQGNKAGIKNEKENRYDFLEMAEVKAKFLSFDEEETAKVTFTLPQIHCSSCLWLLERLTKLNSGIMQSQVTFADKLVEITYNQDKIGLSELARLLSKIGYPPDLSANEMNQKKGKSKLNPVVLKIGIVGFCFGNIMLFSFPEYLGLDESFKNFQSTFNYLNFAFSIPVLFFGAKDYLVSAFKVLRIRQVNIDVPISIGILALYIRSLFEIFSATGAGYLDSFAGLIFFLLIGKWFQSRTFSAINFERDYKSYFPIAVCKLDQIKEIYIPLKDIQVGDELVIRNGEIIPTDSILLSDEAKIDYSFVTGESKLNRKNIGDRLYAGGRVSGQKVFIEVAKEIENSYLTKLWNNPIFHKTKIGNSISNQMSKYFTIVLLVIATIAFFYWMRVDNEKAVFVVTSVLIVACPCAIALSIPFTYGNMVRVLGRNDFYLRSTEVIEPMSKITHLVFDKTGTLSYSDKTGVQWIGDNLSDEVKSDLRAILDQSSHPLSKTLSVFLNSNNRHVSIAAYKEHTGKGLEARIGDKVYLIGSALWLNVENNSEFSSVHVQLNGKYLGYYAFKSEFRDGLEKLFKILGGNYEIHVLSGDINADEQYLRTLLGEKVKFSFNQSPEDKLNYIKMLQEQGGKVMMLGDGLNDAGAIQQADVGLALVDDVHSFSPSSDGILKGAQLSRFNEVFAFVKNGINVVWISYIFSILYNIVGMYFALTGQLTPLVAAILMPLSSISVVLLVTVLTNVLGKKMYSSH